MMMMIKMVVMMMMRRRRRIMLMLFRCAQFVIWTKEPRSLQTMLTGELDENHQLYKERKKYEFITCPNLLDNFV